MSRSAFTLVELSIVLVILGLLTGGILGGQALIRASQLRAIPQEISRYTSAANAFRDKYMAFPGDMTNATAFWGTAAACPGDFTTPATGTATCNGDGNRQIGSPSNYAETWRAWQHLANAGLIEGSYSGVQGSAGDATFGLAGTNIPRSKTEQQQGYAFIFYNQGGAQHFPGPYNNTLFWGSGNSMDEGTVLLPEDAWNIDEKMDDGMPGQGKVRSFLNTYRPNCANSDVASTAIYQVTLKVRGCNLNFLSVI